MPKEAWALLPPAAQAAAITIHNGEASLTNGKITAKLTAAGKIVFLNERGEALLEEFHRNRRETMEEFDSTLAGKSTVKNPMNLRSFVSAVNVEAREFRPIIGGDYELTARFESLSADERIMAWGSTSSRYLDLKGTELELAHRNSQASVPFCLSSLGYGFLWNNPSIGRGHLRQERHGLAFILEQGPRLLGRWPPTVRGHPGALHGRDRQGAHDARLRHGLLAVQAALPNPGGAAQVAREYRRRGVPLSVIVVDFFHWPESGRMEVRSHLLARPQSHGRGAEGHGHRADGLRLADRGTEQRELQGDAREGLSSSAPTGRDELPGDSVHLRRDHPGSRDFVWARRAKNYYDKGIKIFWLDEAEPEYPLYDYDNYRYHLGPDLEVGNIYPVAVRAPSTTV